MAATRWGICGTGLICNDFVKVLKALPDSEHQVVAVAARSSKEKAESFAAQYGIPAAHGTYEDMAKDANVDIVYIGTTHSFHREVSIMYLDHGKHVLCEKPLAMNLKECEDMVAKAKEKKLFLAEGLWTRFFPAYRAMVEEVNSGALGDIVCVRSCLAVPGNETVLNKFGMHMTGGATLATGVYPVTYVQQFFKDRPEKIVAVGQFVEGGSDMGCVITTKYKGGQLGIAYVHGDLAAGGSSVTIHGTKGTLTVEDDMHTPTRVTSSVTGETRHFPLPDIEGPFAWWLSNGLAHEAQAVRECLLKGLTESPQMTHHDSLTVSYILEEACKQIGVTNGIPWA